MSNKPHKHAELIKAWADGAEIQVEKFAFSIAGVHKGSRFEWVDEPNPEWSEFDIFRIKPKEKQKVKMWQWVYRDHDSENIVLTRRFFESEAEALTGVWKVDTLIQKADWTEIEVEVDDE